MPRMTSVLLLAALLFGWSGISQAVPEIQNWRTDNGAAVYFVHAPELPMVDVRVVFAAGASRDGEQLGVGVLTNALMSEGAAGMDADTIAQRFDSVGARFSNSALRDMSIFSLRSLTEPERLEQAVDTFADVLGEPEFPVNALNRERARMRIALKRQEQSPGEIAKKRFYADLYGEHPYANPVLGTEAALERLDQETIRAHYQRYYVAKNATVAIVGDLERDAAARLANRITGRLAPGDPAPALPAPEPLKADVGAILQHPSSQTHVWMGQLGVARGADDWFPLYVGNHILGGSGLVSRVAQEVREKRGLAYSASSRFSPMEARGPFILSLQTANENTEQAMNVLHQTLEEFVTEGPTDDEVERAIKNITGGFPMDIDSNSEIAGYISMIGFYDMPLDYLDRFIERVSAVTPGSIREAFQRRVDPDSLLVVTVGRIDGQS
ncbi:M16 family metallopeptidase [Thiohalomonas denitrificans]|uniref:M16 family metallopeptidase n=1 Tax=Thiohalomonas denitrificans TaxID=415747 RepID=UPI0026F36977|nr:pitrilysin family protein [Thiohalomonas denitrificans]